MSIELTREQQEVLDRRGRVLERIVDPRTHITYVLVPEDEYEKLSEVLEDERREQAIHALALRNAADRLDEVP